MKQWTIIKFQIIMLLIWSCIEVVITGRTRNALALRGTRVRIPPTPRISRNLCFGFFDVALSSISSIAVFLSKRNHCLMAQITATAKILLSSC